MSRQARMARVVSTRVGLDIYRGSAISLLDDIEPLVPKSEVDNKINETVPTFNEDLSDEETLTNRDEPKENLYEKEYDFRKYATPTRKLNSAPNVIKNVGHKISTSSIDYDDVVEKLPPAPRQAAPLVKQIRDDEVKTADEWVNNCLENASSSNTYEAGSDPFRVRRYLPKNFPADKKYLDFEKPDKRKSLKKQESSKKQGKIKSDLQSNFTEFSKSEVRDRKKTGAQLKNAKGEKKNLYKSLLGELNVFMKSQEKENSKAVVVDMEKFQNWLESMESPRNKNEVSDKYRLAAEEFAVEDKKTPETDDKMIKRLIKKKKKSIKRTPSQIKQSCVKPVSTQEAAIGIAKEFITEGPKAAWLNYPTIHARKHAYLDPAPYEVLNKDVLNSWRSTPYNEEDKLDKIIRVTSSKQSLLQDLNYYTLQDFE